MRQILTLGLLSCRLSTHSSRANFALQTLTDALGYCWLLSSKAGHRPLGKWQREHQGTQTVQEGGDMLPAPTWEHAASVFPLQAKEHHRLYSSILQVQMF